MHSCRDAHEALRFTHDTCTRGPEIHLWYMHIRPWDSPMTHAHKALRFTHDTCTRGPEIHSWYMHTRPWGSLMIHAHEALRFTHDTCTHGPEVHSWYMHTRPWDSSKKHVYKALNSNPKTRTLITHKHKNIHTHTYLTWLDTHAHTYKTHERLPNENTQTRTNTRVIWYIVASKRTLICTQKLACTCIYMHKDIDIHVIPAFFRLYMNAYTHKQPTYMRTCNHSHYA
jgi:hypothetical protein